MRCALLVQKTRIERRSTRWRAVTRARAAWLAAAIAVLAAALFLVQTRRRRPVAALAPAQPALVPTAVPPLSVAVESVSAYEPTVLQADPVVDAAAEEPLATWARVAIVVVALLAFFAVSLIATKRV